MLTGILFLGTIVAVCGLMCWLITVETKDGDIRAGGPPRIEGCRRRKMSPGRSLAAARACRSHTGDVSYR